MEFVNRVANTICGIVKHQKPLALVLSLCATHTFMGVDVLEQYIKAETPIAKTSLLANIGPEFKGAKPGVVVASPSRGEGSDPDYVYTWTRDSALVFKVLVDQ
jgi:glucoamylase